MTQTTTPTGAASRTLAMGVTAAANAPGAKPAVTTADPSLVKAAKSFEAIFLRQMIGAMRSSSLSDGLLDSSASEQFRDMSDARTADNMAETGSFGVSDMLIRQLSSPPPAQANPATAAAGYAAGLPLDDKGKMP